MSGRRPSGRPSTTNPSQSGTGVPQPSSASILSLDMRTDQVMASQDLQDAPGDISWPSSRSLVSFEVVDQFMEYPGDASTTDSFDPSAAPEQAMGFLLPDIMPGQSPGSDNASTTRDAVEADIQELTELSLRGYQIVKDARTPSTDELLGMTQSALKVLTRIMTAIQQPEKEDSLARSGGQDARPVSRDGPRISISLVLQAVSVCEQIYNVFVHVCSGLQAALGQNSECSSNSADRDGRFSDAQAVMVVELVNYLFEKLSRSQKQLFAMALPADDPSADSPDYASPEDASTDMSMPSTASQGSSTSVIPIMMHRADGRHPLLHTHIQTIRDLTRKNDCI